MTNPTLTLFAALRQACRKALASLSRVRRHSLGAGSAPRGGAASFGAARQEAA
jgi:hypothetical protein